jgi:hypothetical protein
MNGQKRKKLVIVVNELVVWFGVIAGAFWYDPALGIIIVVLFVLFR